MNLTISYITNRLEPKIEWFFGSLAKQGGTSIDVNVIDFHAEDEERAKKVARLAHHYGIKLNRHITPKPTVWQGKHRLTKADYFAASNASNTAIAICKTDWIVFVDDLSVLRPGWLQSVNEAIQRGGITCGGYRKFWSFRSRMVKWCITKNTHWESTPEKDRLDPGTLFHAVESGSLDAASWRPSKRFSRSMDLMRTATGWECRTASLD